jgi:hypothetical protein
MLSVNFGNYFYAQTSTNISPPSIMSEMTYSEGGRNVSGHYNNSTFGIVDFLIPDGWIGREIVQTPVQFELYMHPIDRTEELSTPDLQLVVMNTSKFIEMSEAMGLMNSTDPVNSYKDLLKSHYQEPVLHCKVETSNSEIDEKSFDITNAKCEDSHSKVYLYETKDKAYTIGMSNISVGNNPDINKYLPILDETASTLKIK